jgi:hypothetical protein
MKNATGERFLTFVRAVALIVVTIALGMNLAVMFGAWSAVPTTPSKLTAPSDHKGYPPMNVYA